MPNTATLPAWPAGHRITGAEAAQILGVLQASNTSGGAWEERIFNRTADQVFQSQTVLQNDNTFVIPLLANATYIWEGMFRYVTNATALFDCAWTIPAGCGGTWTTNGYPAATTATSTSTVVMGDATLTTTQNMGTNGSTANFCPKGSFLNGATAGNAVFTFAQHVSTATNTGMKNQSWLRIVRTA